jgi:Fic family protein
MITSKALNLCSKISESIGKAQGLKLFAIPLKLRRENRIRAIHSSLAIEGNRLTQSQVTDIINNKRVIGPAKDILEVKNAVKAYDALPQFDIYSLDSFLKAHKILMQGLTPDAGKLRSTGVGVFKGNKVMHMAPKAAMVFGLMKDLFSFLKTEKDLHPFMKSSIFHYEAEFIHPFSDGNGRMGRLWQSAIILKTYPIFEFIPIESLIKKNQKEYYRVLELCDKQGDSTLFVEFMLQIIVETTEKFIQETRPQAQTSYNRMESAVAYFGKKDFSRKDYMLLHKDISSATASRDLETAAKDKRLKKIGDKALTRYKFI